MASKSPERSDVHSDEQDACPKALGSRLLATKDLQDTGAPD